MAVKKFAEIHNEVVVTPLTQSINFGYPSKTMGKLLGVKPIPFVAVYSKEKVILYTDANYWVNTDKMIVAKTKTDINFFHILLKQSERLKIKTISLIQDLNFKIK